MAARLGWTIAAITAAAAAAGYRALVSGQLTLELGIGWRTRALRPQVLDIAAPRELVFDVIAQPYLGRPTRAQREKIQVLERGEGMVLAAHRTPVGRGLVTHTVETVTLTRPDTVDFRLVRGPVPYVRERFSLTDDGGHTRLEYTGEMGTDGWALGAGWAAVVARRWEATVADALATVKSEAERRHEHGQG
ncbi:Polyketide cyclase / dehydrase and lipid transport [Micromonospora viridifaciens]|uniref:Polyketide cyclase / dehydrase and lipid transport n=1 Tax=Micromonospora viridifaciens TaxID=1881 RepID=A0A1C4WGK4_MICVI|nr:SRPBCC family protein [Micromonospora viridifaciens]SCE95279.1 Polyketide cyclase / dehydrase and lipid transport [Micromonospora viridifaciens]